MKDNTRTSRNQIKPMNSSGQKSKTTWNTKHLNHSLDKTQDSFGEDRKLLDDRIPNPTFDDIDQKEKEFRMLERKARFDGAPMFNLSRRLVNSGLLNKMDNVEDVKQLGWCLVNLESLHLTHIGELPEQKKLWVNKRTTNDDIKRH